MDDLEDAEREIQVALRMVTPLERPDVLATLSAIRRTQDRAAPRGAPRDRRQRPGARPQRTPGPWLWLAPSSVGTAPSCGRVASSTRGLPVRWLARPGLRGGRRVGRGTAAGASAVRMGSTTPLSGRAQAELIAPGRFAR